MKNSPLACQAESGGCRRRLERGAASAVECVKAPLRKGRKETQFPEGFCKLIEYCFSLKQTLLFSLLQRETYFGSSFLGNKFYS